MKRLFWMGMVLACAPALAQVRCKMPNGVWIEQKLSSVCPAGALQGQTLDGQPIALPKPSPPAPRVAVPEKRAAPLPARSERRPMPFEACVRLLTQTVLSVGGVNTRVVLTTPEARMLRVCTNDGSVLLTCSRDDALLVTTASSTRCH